MKYTITKQEYKKLQEQYDVVLPPIEVEPLPRSLSGQITDWGGALHESKTMTSIDNKKTFN